MYHGRTALRHSGAGMGTQDIVSFKIIVSIEQHRIERSYCLRLFLSIRESLTMARNFKSLNEAVVEL